MPVAAEKSLIGSRKATLKDLIASRDDIMEDLTKAGIEREIAFKVADNGVSAKERVNFFKFFCIFTDST